MLASFHIQMDIGEGVEAGNAKIDWLASVEALARVGQAGGSRTQLAEFILHQGAGCRRYLLADDVAEDGNHDILSEWSPATTVVISPLTETIAAPNMSGSSADVAAVGQNALVSCLETSSNLGHSLEYRFDLGDGTETSWSADTFGYFHWSAVGTYIIRAQARCAEHTDVVSDWTPTGEHEEIEITDSTKILSKPVIQAHGDIPINLLMGFSVSSSSNLGHALEYLVEWGDGTPSTWGLSALHIYTELGDYSMRMKARCTIHPDTESEWSDVDTVHVVELVSQPTLTGPATGVEETTGLYTVTGSTSNLDHRGQPGIHFSRRSRYCRNLLCAGPVALPRTFDGEYSFSRGRDSRVRPVGGGRSERPALGCQPPHLRPG